MVTDIYRLSALWIILRQGCGFATRNYSFGPSIKVVVCGRIVCTDSGDYVVVTVVGVPLVICDKKGPSGALKLPSEVTNTRTLYRCNGRTGTS